MNADERRSTNETEIGEHAQESFSDEYVNVHCVASWRLNSSKRLTVNFHNSWHFDSDRYNGGSVRIKSAIDELKRIS